MAKTTTKTVTSKASTAKKAKVTESATEVVEATPAKVETATTEVVTEETNKDTLVAKEVDIHQMITVRNGFQGTLVYKDKRTGADYRWDNFGDEQDIELSELRNARGSARKFFENNWFLFDEAWVPEYLGVGRYYKHALNSENFDEIFSKSPEEIEATIPELTAGQRKSVEYRARQLIASGDIDSRKVVSALEKCLGVDLIEK